MFRKIGSTLLVVVVIYTLLSSCETPHPAFSGWKQVVVTPGQTEWEIGHNYCPAVDTNDVVQAMMGYNHIGADIKPGDKLWVPTQATSARLDFFTPKYE